MTKAFNVVVNKKKKGEKEEKRKSFQHFRIWSGAKSTNLVKAQLEKCCKIRNLDAKIGVDTQENGPSKVWGP